ncbi:MAG: NAD(P)-dependent alcohol dehydrogenase [Cyclobacteriaceae bacterium]|nr:NAD(P)-dependent alcohol dehydrogenase [Cyclobacteriaceae bacterium]
MRAVLYGSYGGVEVMQWGNIPLPKPGHHQILVRTIATSLNPVDWRIRNGEMQLMVNNKFPKGIGLDFAGIVEAVGKDVSRFNVGDEVFGLLSYQNAGSIAEYVIADEKLTTKKPIGISFEEAASLPMAGVASLTALIDKGKISGNMNVLINGCTGGVGQLAVMIAKNAGAHVTGTCSTQAKEKAKQLGVDIVIDFTKDNVLEMEQAFDLIFDTAGNLSYNNCKSILKSQGVFLELNITISNLFFGWYNNMFSSKKVRSIIAKPSLDKIVLLGNLASKGKLKPIIGKQYMLKDALEAYKNVENGEKNIGKTIVVNSM